MFGAALSTLPRAAILHAAESARLQRLVQQHGKRVGAARFVAGETLDECVGVLRKLNDAGLHANTTLLGEAIPDPEGASTVTAEYERIIERLAAEKLKANVALKLKHLGLAFDEEVAYANDERLVARAGELGSFLRIGMEQPSTSRSRSASTSTPGPANMRLVKRSPYGWTSSFELVLVRGHSRWVTRRMDPSEID